MTTRIPHQCLRIAVKQPFRAHSRTCIRTYVSATPAEQPLETPPPSTQSSEIKTSAKPNNPSRIIPTQGIPSQTRNVDNIDVLPFDPPPRPARKAPSMDLPALDTNVEDLVECPPGSRGPIPLRIRKPFPVNQSWDVLHRFYTGLFGFEDYIERGYITKELAWQSVTYKSYNHGVDPYNEKLAHLGSPLNHLIHVSFSRRLLTVGKRAIKMVTATHVLNLPTESQDSPRIDSLNVNALSKSLIANIMDYHLIGDMGLRYGVAEIMRWKPAFVFLIYEKADLE